MLATYIRTNLTIRPTTLSTFCLAHKKKYLSQVLPSAFSLMSINTHAMHSNPIGNSNSNSNNVKVRQIEAALEEGQVDIARRLFSEFSEEQKLSRQIISSLKSLYHFVVSHYPAINHRLRQNFLKLMREVGMIPTSSEYITILKKCHDSHDAVLVFDMLQEDYPNNVSNETYHQVIAVCAANKWMSLAWSYWEEMRRLKLSPLSSTYQLLIEYLPIDHMDNIRQLLNEMKIAGFQLDAKAYTSILYKYLQRRNVAEVAQFYSEMIKSGFTPQTNLYDQLISFFLEVQHLHDALKCFEDMKKKNISPTANTFNNLLRYCISKRKDSLAIEIYNQMLTYGFVVDQRTIAKLMVLINKPEKEEKMEEQPKTQQDKEKKRKYDAKSAYHHWNL